jgi:hypothetical protein
MTARGGRLCPCVAVDRASESLKRGHSFRRSAALGPGNSEPRGLGESCSPAKKRRSGVLPVGKSPLAVDNYSWATLKSLLRGGFIPNC